MSQRISDLVAEEILASHSVSNVMVVEQIAKDSASDKADRSACELVGQILETKERLTREIGGGAYTRAYAFTTMATLWRAYKLPMA